MAENEIANGNELIAKFMGYQILNKKFQYLNYNSSNESYWEWDEGDIVCDKNGNEVSEGDSDPYYSFDELPFDSSWDWLMQALEKISQIKISTHEYPIKYNIQYGFCLISYMGSTHGQTLTVKSIDRKDGETTIQCVWLAVVDFLEWYNKEYGNKE